MISSREACIIFNMISGIGFVKFNALSNFFGSPEAALQASVEELMMVHGVGEQLSRRIFAWPEQVDWRAETGRAEQGGVKIITLFDEHYPAVLRELPDPPLCLYVAGKLPNFDRMDTIGVVGSRRASSYGRRMARLLSTQAVAAGWGTVSGLAYGIDYEAHDATVKSGGITVAVLGGGLGNIQPQDHVPLARSIIQSGGAVITEFPMMFPVSRTSFPRRNRIIAGLSRGVIVVEAGVDSGAMITANLANDYGKTVFAVPGAVENPQSAGCHFLIKHGEARLTESFQDVMEEFNPALEQDTFNFSESKEAYKAVSQVKLDAAEQKIVDFLHEKGESSYDELALAIEFDSGILAGKLIGLEMKMLVRQNPGRRYSLR